MKIKKKNQTLNNVFINTRLKVKKRELLCQWIYTGMHFLSLLVSWDILITYCFRFVYALLYFREVYCNIIKILFIWVSNIKIPYIILCIFIKITICGRLLIYYCYLYHNTKGSCQGLYYNSLFSVAYS